jgi:hypothetical protein
MRPAGSGVGLRLTGFYSYAAALGKKKARIAKKISRRSSVRFESQSQFSGSTGTGTSAQISSLNRIQDGCKASVWRGLP